jgi:hypothetical protein
LFGKGHCALPFYRNRHDFGDFGCQVAVLLM